MQFKLIICLLFITGSLSSDWENFKRDFDKQYASPEEETEREQIFLENVDRIKEYERTHPDATFTMEINHLTDQHISELVTGSKSFLNIRSEVIEDTIQPKTIIPTRWNWRSRNVTTPIYNQTQYASIPAIAAVEVIESFNAIQTNNLIRGSVEQVNACCGNMIDIFDCILDALKGGICSEDTYDVSNGSCVPSKCKPFVTFKEVNKLERGKENIMLDWIQDSTLYAAIDANQSTFLAYKSGIYSDTNCAKNDYNHVVQIIGYGFQSGRPYWLCKNSWGEGWGEEGYIRIERGRNMCGIASYVVQIKTPNDVNHAVRLFTFDIVYLAVFCLFGHIFTKLK